MPQMVNISHETAETIYRVYVEADELERSRAPSTIRAALELKQAVEAGSREALVAALTPRPAPTVRKS
jgi:hypothetical protein